jgi:hypothetical protein
MSLMWSRQEGLLWRLFWLMVFCCTRMQNLLHSVHHDIENF